MKAWPKSVFTCGCLAGFTSITAYWLNSRFGSVRLDGWPEHLATFLGLLAMSSPKSGKSASTVPSDSAAFYLSPTAYATAVGDVRTPASDNGATSCDRTATINTACDHTATINTASIGIAGATGVIWIVRITIISAIITAATGYNGSSSNDCSATIGGTAPNCATTIGGTASDCATSVGAAALASH